MFATDNSGSLRNPCVAVRWPYLCTLALPSQKEAAIRPGGRQSSLRKEFFRLAERSVRVRRGPAQGSRLPAGSCVRPGRVKARSSEPASEAAAILAKRWLSLSIKSQAAPPFFPLGSEHIDPAQFRPFGDELGSRAAKVGLEGVAEESRSSRWRRVLRSGSSHRGHGAITLQRAPPRWAISRSIVHSGSRRADASQVFRAVG